MVEQPLPKERIDDLALADRTIAAPYYRRMKEDILTACRRK